MKSLLCLLVAFKVTMCGSGCTLTGTTISVTGGVRDDKTGTFLGGTIQRTISDSKTIKPIK